MRACVRDVFAIYDNNISPRLIMIIVGVKFPFFGRSYLEKYLTDFSKNVHSGFYHGCE